MIKIFYNADEFQLSDTMPSDGLAIINELYSKDEKKISRSAIYNKEKLIMETEEEFSDLEQWLIDKYSAKPTKSIKTAEVLLLILDTVNKILEKVEELADRKCHCE